MPKLNELTPEQVNDIYDRARSAKTPEESAAVLAEIEDDDPIDDPLQDALETPAAPGPLRTPTPAEPSEPASRDYYGEGTPETPGSVGFIDTTPRLPSDACEVTLYPNGKLRCNRQLTAWLKNMHWKNVRVSIPDDTPAGQIPPEIMMGEQRNGMFLFPKDNSETCEARLGAMMGPNLKAVWPTVQYTTKVTTTDNNPIPGWPNLDLVRIPVSPSVRKRRKAPRLPVFTDAERRARRPEPADLYEAPKGKRRRITAVSLASRDDDATITFVTTKYKGSKQIETTETTRLATFREWVGRGAKLVHDPNDQGLIARADCDPNYLDDLL